MKYRFAPAATCAALLIAVSACGQLGDKALTPAETNASFEAFVKAVARKEAKELTPDELKEAINQYIGLRVAAESATKQGLDKDPKVRPQLDLTRTNVLSEALLQRYLEQNPVNDADIKAEYDTQVAGVPPEYKARHVLVDDEALAKAIIEKLKAKGDFAALAKQYSKDGSAQNGGDLGWFSPNAMVKEFSDAVVKLEKGAFSQEPVKSQFGWHVIQLDDKRTAQVPDLEQVKDRVKQIVQRKRVQEHLEELKKSSKINADKLTADLTAYATAPKPAEPAPADAPAPGAAAAPTATPTAPAEPAATPNP